MLKGVIFDLDGVITSTDEFHYEAWLELANRLGIKGFNREENLKQRGVSRMESLEVVLALGTKKYSENEKIAFANEKNEIYKTLLEQMDESYLSKEVYDTLKELRKRGYKLAIGSSSKNTKFILSKIGLRDFFDAISDGNNITHSKPNPEVFLKAASMLDLLPNECAVVEDATAGIDAANAGGFVSYGIGPASVYDKCQVSIHSFKELLNTL